MLDTLLSKLERVTLIAGTTSDFSRKKRALILKMNLMRFSNSSCRFSIYKFKASWMNKIKSIVIHGPSSRVVSVARLPDASYRTKIFPAISIRFARKSISFLSLTLIPKLSTAKAYYFYSVSKAYFLFKSEATNEQIARYRTIKNCS